jgi:hypothetical protein
MTGFRENRSPGPKLWQEIVVAGDVGKQLGYADCRFHLALTDGPPAPGPLLPCSSVWHPPGTLLRPRLELALGAHWGWALLGGHDRAQLSSLYAAALRDVSAERIEAVATQLHFSDARAAHRASAKGRRLLGRLAVWPWSCWDCGRPPPRWRSHGEDPCTWEAFERWLRL